MGESDGFNRTGQRPRLESGDYVLIERLARGPEQKFPDSMLLVLVDEDDGRKIRLRQDRILGPYLDLNQNPFLDTYDDDLNRRHYSDLFDFRGRLKIPGENEPDYRTHFGRDEVVQALEFYPEYRIYADILKVTDPVLRAREEKKLGPSMEDALVSEL